MYFPAFYCSLPSLAVLYTSVEVVVGWIGWNKCIPSNGPLPRWKQHTTKHYHVNHKFHSSLANPWCWHSHNKWERPVKCFRVKMQFKRNKYLTLPGLLMIESQEKSIFQNNEIQVPTTNQSCFSQVCLGDVCLVLSPCRPSWQITNF